MSYFSLLPLLLSPQHCSHLESLSLADNDCGYDGAGAVARLIKYNKKLKRLDISRNNIAWEALMLIGKALAINSVLEELKVGNHRVPKPLIHFEILIT